MRFYILLGAWCMLWSCAPTTTVNYPATEFIHCLGQQFLKEPAHCSMPYDSIHPFEEYSYAYDSIYAGFITRWFPPVPMQDSCKALEQHLLTGCFTPDIQKIKKELGAKQISKVLLEVNAFQQKAFPVYLLKTTTWNSAVFQKITQPVAQQQATFEIQKVLTPWQSCSAFQFCKKTALHTAPLSLPHRSKFTVPLQQPFRVDVTREFKEMLQRGADGNTGFCITATAPETHYQANNKVLGSFSVQFHIELKR